MHAVVATLSACLAYRSYSNSTYGMKNVQKPERHYHDNRKYHDILIIVTRLF